MKIIRVIQRVGLFAALGFISGGPIIGSEDKCAIQTDHGVYNYGDKLALTGWDPGWKVMLGCNLEDFKRNAAIGLMNYHCKQTKGNRRIGNAYKGKEFTCTPCGGVTDTDHTTACDAGFEGRDKYELMGLDRHCECNKITITSNEVERDDEGEW